jgi:hypothetical protein
MCFYRFLKFNATQEPEPPLSQGSANAEVPTAEIVSPASGLPIPNPSDPVLITPDAPILKGYRIVGQLGRGRSVWLAEETTSGLNRRVVVRVGRPDPPEARGRLRVCSRRASVRNPC